MSYAVKRPPLTTKPHRSWFDYEDVGDHPAVYDLTVYEDEGYEPTGLLDEEGNEIVRYVKAPLGFLSEVI